MTQNSTFVLPVNNQTTNSILSTNFAGDSEWTNTPTLNQIICNGTGLFGSISSSNVVVSQGNVVVSQGGIQYGPTGPVIRCVNGTYTGLLVGKDSDDNTQFTSPISGTYNRNGGQVMFTLPDVVPTYTGGLSYTLTIPTGIRPTSQVRGLLPIRNNNVYSTGLFLSNFDYSLQITQSNGDLIIGHLNGGIQLGSSISYLIDPTTPYTLTYT